MHLYSMRDVERVLQLPRSTLQGLVRLGFVRPGRGPRRQYLFSFQDLIILRAARALIAANIPRRRIRSSLGQLQGAAARGCAALGPRHLRGRRPRGRARGTQPLAGR